MRTLLLYIPLLFAPTLTMCQDLSTPASVVKEQPRETGAGPITVSVQPKTITFPSQDKLQITADEYVVNDTLPWILLCHQAHYSRGEYRETAPQFAAFGYNCLAIDQRSGSEVNGVKNETAEKAKAAGKPQEYLDAEQDIVAALDYLYEKSKKPVILVGSSYSAGLVLKIAVNNPKVKAVLAFSPGEYYGDRLPLAKTIAPLTKPVFITCARQEIDDLKPIVEAIQSQQKTFFRPESPGRHASSTLWKSTDNSAEYWTAVAAFFNTLK